jgi:hypothetical protein
MRRLGLDADSELTGMSETAIPTGRRGAVGRALCQKARKSKKRATGCARHMRALGTDAKNYNDEIPDPDLVIPE